MGRAMALAAGLAFLASACGGGGGHADGGPDSPPLDERLEPGQVRAGVITRESELLSGPEAHGWLGDFKLYNHRVAFIVQNAFEPRGWGPYGGSLLDAVLLADDGSSGEEEFEEAFTHIDVLGVEPTAAEVLSDGSDGQPAQVRITGRHKGIPLIDGATNGALIAQDLEIVQDFVLAPDADHLVIRTSVRTNAGGERLVTVGDLVLNGDRTLDFAPGRGDLDGQLPDTPEAYYAGYSRVGCNLYAPAEGTIQPAFTIEGVTPINVAEGLAPRARGDTEPLVVERLVLVGAGGMDDCLRRFRRLRGEEASAGWVAGTVSRPGGEPESDARVYAHDLSMDENLDVVDQAYADANGDFELELPAGEYRLEAISPGRDPVLGDALSVTAGQTVDAQLTVPAPAVLAWACTGRERDGTDLGPMPCKVSLQAGPDAPLSAPVATDYLTFSASGASELVAPAGQWTVTLSRGWEYGIVRHEVVLQPGQRVEVEAELDHQVDTDGWIAADLHNHSTRSADSEFELLDKLRANVAEGLELMVATDHDCQADFGPWLDRLAQMENTDLHRFLRTVVGNEISPLYGHMTAFPLPTHPTGWIYWQVPWVLYEDGQFSRSLEFPELWVRIRELGAEVINVCHPTRSSGWFSYLGFEPPEVMPALDELDPARWGTGFDTMEMLNSKSTGVMLDELVQLWAHLNNQGLFKTAVGVSDSHGRTSEVGFGRTMVAVSDDHPATLDLDEVWTSLKAGHALVGGGLMVTIHIGQAGPGDLVSADSPVVVNLRVEAADWVEVDQVALWANGEVIATEPLSPPGQLDPERPALRYDGLIQVDLEADTWFAAVATGPANARLDPVVRNARPVGMTNAVRVDIDGDGQFTPPGP